MKKAKNIFTKGVIAGADILNHPADSLFGARNAEFLSTEGNLFAVSRQRGNSFAGLVKPGYVPVAAKSNRGVAFIFSVEVNGGKPTGKAEIGTFPSPKFTVQGEHTLENVYRPLMNYGGDTGLYPNLDGPFTSSNFNIIDGSDFEMELQNDYDGSVNIILNDGKNPTWIINSGFAVQENGLAEIISRTGKQTNKYSAENFKNTLRLILNSTKILNLKFNGVNTGGKLRAGHYRYFFYYMTNDGTLTQMVNESMDVHVFNGTNPATIVGDLGEGAETGKMVSFDLSNLDNSFPFIKVYFTYSNGVTDAVRSAFELINPVRFQGNSVSFNHTGFEAQSGISPDFLNKRIGSIESVGSIAQIQGHLFAANIKEKGESIKTFRKFAAKIKTGSKQINMDLFGTGQNFQGIGQGVISSSRIADAFEGGYYNPFNVYNYSGYFGRETYPFGIVFIYKNGAVTPAFPVLGVDNESGGNDGLLSNVTDTQIDQMIQNGGYLSGSTDLVNVNGIYRFPSRETNSGLLLNPLDSTQAKINGVTFQLPNINAVEFKELKEETIGFYFVRGERKPDLISQGYLIDTVTVPSIDLGLPNENFNVMARYRAGYSPITSKFVPAFDFMLEAVKSYELYGGSQSNEKRSNYKGNGGIHPFKFNFRNKDFAFKEKFAFISPEVILDKERILQVLSSKNVDIQVLGKVLTRYDIASNNAISGTADHFSLIRTERFEKQVQTLQGKANWVIGGSGLRNNEGFSAGLFVNARQRGSREFYYLHFPLKFNDYVGITIPSKFTLGNPAPLNTEEDGQLDRDLYGKQRKAAALVNIYEDGGPRTSAIIQSIYTSTANESYQQISPRYYWNQNIEGADPELALENVVDANGKVVVFGGDCYINPIYRKLFFNYYQDQTSPTDDTNENSKCNVGYTLGLVTESHLNAAFRSEEIADINEPGKRTFAPFGMDSNSPGDKFGEDVALRKSRVLESASFNKGFKSVLSQRNYFTISDDNSFNGTNWFSRIIVSAKHTPNSFDNGYRNLNGINFQDYNPELGKIVRIMNYQDNLLAVYENGVLLIPVNQRIQTGSDAGGSIFIEAQGILPPAASPVSLDTGSKWHDSIVNAYGTVFGIDSDKDIIWAIQNGALSEISLMRYDATLTEFLESYKNKKKSIFFNLVANHLHKKVVWSFIGKTNGTDTIGYDMLLEGFIGGVDYAPILSFALPGRQYTFDSKTLQNRFYLQESKEVNYGNYYGKQYPFKISFAVNQEPDIQKTFDNLSIISNNVLPTKIIYRTQGTRTIQAVVYNPQVRRLSNAFYRGNQADIAIPPVGEITQESEYDFIDVAKANARAILRKKSRQKGHGILIELIYEGLGLVKINSVLTEYRDTL